MIAYGGFYGVFICYDRKVGMKSICNDWFGCLIMFKFYSFLFAMLTVSYMNILFVR